MKVLHDLVAVRGEFCFAAVGWAVVCVTGVSREGLSRVLMLKSEDLPVDGYCSATRNWLVRTGGKKSVLFSLLKYGNSCDSAGVFICVLFDLLS